MKDDLISRQGVIEVLSQYPFEKAVNCISIIEELPSAQPEHTETHSCDYKRTETHDLVSRRAALEALDTWDKFGCDPDGKLVRYDDDKHYVPYVHYEDMVHAVKNLPPAQPRWIPVTERLPEPRVDVWTCSDIGQIQGYYEENVGVWYASFGQGRDYLELIVTAWMPLPEPYKEGQDEQTD